MYRTTLFWRSTLFATICLAATSGSLRAQSSSSHFQIHALGVAADQSLVGLGGGVGFRPRGRVGFVGTATVGRRQEIAVRFEGLVTYHLDPVKDSGVKAYVLGGVAVQTAPGDPRLVLGVGVEQSPGGASGWFSEVGFGGGVRLAVGFRVHPGPGR